MPGRPTAKLQFLEEEGAEAICKSLLENELSVEIEDTGPGVHFPKAVPQFHYFLRKVVNFSKPAFSV